MLRKLYSRLKHSRYWLSDRKGFFLARLFGMRVPMFPLMFLPDGFTVRWAGRTGLAIAENFCTPEEAAYLIDRARNRLRDSRITINNKQLKDDYRTSKTAMVFGPNDMDPAVLPFLYRASMLLGVSYNNAETIFVTRYQSGEYYKAHEDFYPGFDGDRLYTVLIYLNDLTEDQGGGTTFEKLNIGVRPKLGRAVIWTNKNPDGSNHTETRHEALPVAEGAEKWVIQLWFRNYTMIPVPDALLETPQTRVGEALSGEETLPEGMWAPGEVEPDSPYANAFKQP